MNLKNSLLFILASASFSLFAESLSTTNGVTYQNVSIISASPESMLVVHDGGGSQIAYTDLVPDSLTPSQRRTVESKLKEHVDRTNKQEALKLERENFALEQKKKGYVLFEEEWMPPQTRQDILAQRALYKLEREKKQMDLEIKKAELREQKMAAERERREMQQTKTVTTIYTSPYRTVHHPYTPPSYCYPNKSPYKSHSHSRRGGLNISINKNGNSLHYQSPSQCRSTSTRTHHSF